MDLVRDLISLGRNIRDEENIKVRQPLSEIILDAKNKDILSDVTNLIKEELNVKKVVFETDLSRYMNFSIKPNFKEAGKVFGSKMKDYVNYLNTLDEEKIKNVDSENLEFEGTKITKDLVDVKISSKEGMSVGMDKDKFVILNTTLNEDLLKEGFAREVISKIQNLRKEKDFDVENRIKLYYSSNDYFEEVLKDYKDYISKEILAVELIKKEDLDYKFKINNEEICFDVERI